MVKSTVKIDSLLFIRPSERDLRECDTEISSLNNMIRKKTALVVNKWETMVPSQIQVILYQTKQSIGTTVPIKV